MNKVFTLLFLLFNLSAISQNEFKKLPKGSCSIDHNCKVEYFKDYFENIEKYKIPFSNTVLGKSSGGSNLLYSLHKYILKDKSENIYIYFYGNIKACRDENSYIHFLFKDGTEDKVVTSNSNIECGTGFIPIMVNKNFMESLNNKKIQKIRLQFNDGKEDFIIISKGQQKLFKNIACIVDINEALK